MNSPAISVIIPAYNEEKYLHVMLDCVLRQTMRNYEIIVVNDGSTDGTQAVIDEYVSKHEIIRCITQSNQGLSASRNNALRLAKGEYIAFLDADDVIRDNYLELLYSAAKLNGSDIAKCSYIDFDDESGKILTTISVADREIDFEPGYKYVFQYCAWAGLYRKEFIDRYSLRYSVGEQMEDSPFSLTAHPLANNVAVVNDTLYSHRMHSGSIMANVSGAKKDPKIPYRGFEKAVNDVRSYVTDPQRLNIADYCFVRVLSDYATQRYKTQGSEVRKELCAYFKRIMDTYFSNIMCNPYLFGKKAANIEKLPLFEREAVKLFVLSYKFNAIYPFSSAVSSVLRRLV